MAFNLTMEEQDLANQRVAQLRQNAHQRFMQGRSNFVGSNPNAVSPGERAAFAPPSVQTLALRQHEMDMLKQQGENALGVEKEHSAGLRGQGAEAAGLRGEAERDVARITGETAREVENIRGRNALSVEEQRMLGAENVETIKGETARDVAKTTGEYDVLKQAEANKGEIAKSELKQREYEAALTTKIKQAQIAAGAKVDAATAGKQAKIIGDAMKAGALMGKDTTTVLGELSETYKNDPGMLGAIRAVNGAGTTTASTGRGGPVATGTQKDGDRIETKQGWAVRRGGKWVLESK